MQNLVHLVKFSYVNIVLLCLVNYVRLHILYQEAFHQYQIYVLVFHYFNEFPKLTLTIELIPSIFLKGLSLVKYLGIISLFYNIIRIC